VLVSTFVRAAGGCVSTRRLRDAGIADDTLRAAVAAGDVLRIRRGWYVIPDLPDERMGAAAAGGAVSCVSALRMYGVWVLGDQGLHVRCAPGTSHGNGVHRRHLGSGAIQVGGIDDIGAALSVASRCMPLEGAVASVDSALNRGLVSTSVVQLVCPERVWKLTDPRSESGVETIARLRLRSHRLRVRTQVAIEGVGRIDLVIGDRLILEVDGRAWHDRPGDFENDRARDRELISRGYVVVRASYRQVLEWTQLEAQILGLVQRREHLWRARHQRLAR